MLGYWDLSGSVRWRGAWGEGVDGVKLEKTSRTTRYGVVPPGSDVVNY
jgi:hypothetical protein